MCDGFILSQNTNLHGSHAKHLCGTFVWLINTCIQIREYAKITSIIQSLVVHYLHVNVLIITSLSALGWYLHNQLSISDEWLVQNLNKKLTHFPSRLTIKFQTLLSADFICTLFDSRGHQWAHSLPMAKVRHHRCEAGFHTFFHPVSHISHYKESPLRMAKWECFGRVCNYMWIWCSF